MGLTVDLSSMSDDELMDLIKEGMATNNDIDVDTRGASALSSARGRFRNLAMLGGGNYKRGASALSSARGRFRNLAMLGGMGNYKRSDDEDLYAPPAWF